MNQFESDRQPPLSYSDQEKKPVDLKEAGRIYLTIFVSICVILLLIAYIKTDNTMLLVADGTIAGGAFVTIITYYFNQK